MNLLCAEGLAGAGELRVDQCLATLDQWAAHVKSETERNFHRFQDRPEDFENSEGYFRMLMMAVVVYEDFQVRYNPARISSPGQAGSDDGFFADARDVFLRGLLDGRRMGTCSSMPVLYVALARRLGYPVFLVTTKAHLFLRWENEKERFDLEATGRGMNRYDDDHFRQWPFPVTPQEEKAEGYLKSLTAVGELAVFLSIRGQCLLEGGRSEEAVASFAAAARLAPESRGYRLLWEDAADRFARKNELPAPLKAPSETAPGRNPTQMVPAGWASSRPDPKPLFNLPSGQYQSSLLIEH